MNCSVAFAAEGNQVLLRIVATLAAELPVVHLKIRHRATELTSPAVAVQDLEPQIFVQLGVKS